MPKERHGQSLWFLNIDYTSVKTSQPEFFDTELDKQDILGFVNGMTGLTQVSIRAAVDVEVLD
jgi:hypothetical protein